MLAARRLVPIKALFRSAIEATRENCVRVLEETKAGIFAEIPQVLVAEVRRNPRTIVPKILDRMIEATVFEIRRRVKAS